MVLSLVFLFFIGLIVFYIVVQIDMIVQADKQKQPVLVYPGTKIPVEDPNHVDFASVAMWSEVYGDN